MKSTLKDNISLLREHYPPMAGIPEDQLLRLIRTYELEKGDSITFNGDLEECVFVLSGEVEQASAGEISRLLRPRNTLTRPVCLAGQRIGFEAKTASLLGRINPARLDFLLSWESLREGTESDPFRTWLSELRNPLIFGQLPLENAQEVFRRLQPRSAEAGEVIFDKGEEATEFYFIESGSAELWRAGLYDDELQKTKVLTAGDYFGEEALVSGGSRSAKVRMIEQSRLLTLAKEDFDELINAPMIDRVSAKVANAMLEDGAKLLDVRYNDEYELEYIPGCKLIPLPELNDRIEELETGSNYVVYCHSGKRSDVAAMVLRQHKMHAVSLTGGIRDWPYAIEHPQ